MSAPDASVAPRDAMVTTNPDAAATTNPDATVTHPDASMGSPSSKMIGVAGGELTIGGLTLSIPPSAVQMTQLLTVTIASQTAPDGYESFSPVYAFEPDGLTFALPVRISIDMTPGATSPELLWSRPGSTTEFDAVAATVVGDTLVGDITHFSRGFAGRRRVSADAGVAPDAAMMNPDAAMMNPDAAMTNPDAAMMSPDAAMMSPDAAAGPADSGVMACTALDPGTRAVTETVVHANFPAPVGGTIAPGTYVMVERTRYDGPGGTANPGIGTFYQSLRFGATSYEQVFRLEAAGQVHVGALTANWSTMGTEFRLEGLCPNPQMAMSPYSVVGNRFIQYAGTTTGIASTFELQ